MIRSHSNSDLPCRLYTAQQVRALDQLMMEHIPITSLQLMRGAASFILATVLQRWPQLRHLVVFVGTGNNGGDGFYLALLAAAEGISVQVLECGSSEHLSADASSARRDAQAAGVSCKPFDPQQDPLSTESSLATVLVDAMLGTGFKGELRKPYAEAIDWINGSGLPVLSVDIPSGLSCDTGQVMSTAIRATMTVCLVGLKQGLLTAQGPDHCGEILFHDLGMPDFVKQSPVAMTPSCTRIDIRTISGKLAPRLQSTHKGQCGNVLVVGGDLAYGGAALLAAEAAARIGAGTVSLLTRPAHVMAALARRPEIMVRGIDGPDGYSVEQLLDLLERATVVVIGPGLGCSDWGRSLLQQVLRYAGSTLPVVLDADALNLLVDERVGEDLPPCNARQWVLTPHPGEAARLLRSSVAQVQADRFAAVASLRSRWGGAVVLKGAGSLLCSLSEEGAAVLELCTEGNPGMATGGMGDVLSGVIGGLLAQGLSPANALRCGVCIHGEAADLAVAQEGERGLLATDVLPYIRRLANPR